ncbi:DUF4129 domain-containing protein [Polaribacter sp.]|nr:DUF4129 domain-containing protein [Polaribacter sp.]MDG1246352.1 DUF4129 domain-containing protein [Polaribacter sp.]
MCFTITLFSQEKITGIRIDSSQVIQKKFDQKVLESFKTQDDFNYSIAPNEANVFERIWAWLGRVVKRILSFIFDDIGPAVGVLAAIVKAIPWIVLGLLLFFILKFFLKVNTRNATDVLETIPSIQLTNDEELINNMQLNELIAQAIQVKDYRLAVRFHYLLILQKLTDKELIVWQQEKTNEDFIREVAKLKIASDFIEITQLYDFVWYGNFEINEPEFLKATTLFNTLKNKILG